MQPFHPHRHPLRQLNNNTNPQYNPNHLPPAPSPWHTPSPYPFPDFTPTDSQFPPLRPPRTTYRRTRQPAPRQHPEAPTGRGAAAAGRWEPPPPPRLEQPGPRPRTGHGAQRGAPSETGSFPPRRSMERIVEEGPRLRFAQITNIRIIVPIIDAPLHRDVGTQCNRAWEEFMEMPLPEGYVLPPTHQGGGPFVPLNRSPSPPPLVPITWVELPTEPAQDPSDLPEYFGLADLQRLQAERE